MHVYIANLQVVAAAVRDLYIGDMCCDLTVNYQVCLSTVE